MKEKVGFLDYHELGSGLGCGRLSIGTIIHNFAGSLQVHSCSGQIDVHELKVPQNVETRRLQAEDFSL